MKGISSENEAAVREFLAATDQTVIYLADLRRCLNNGKGVSRQRVHQPKLHAALENLVTQSQCRLATTEEAREYASKKKRAQNEQAIATTNALVAQYVKETTLTIATIAEKVDRSPRTVQRALARLGEPRSPYSPDAIANREATKRRKQAASRKQA